MKSRAALVACSTFLALIAGAPAVYAQQFDTEQIDEQAVHKAVDRAVEFLWSQWNERTFWESGPRPRDPNSREGLNYGGQTAHVVYALLASGVNYKDPRMAKTLAWLEGLKMRGTYALALRANIWASLPMSRYRKNLQADTGQLIKSLQMADNDNRGGYTYPATGEPPFTPWADNSNAQFGLLGVWAGARHGIEVPKKYWEIVMEFWKRRQTPDGGWSYGGADRKPYGSMSAAGLASVFICFDALYTEEFINCRGQVSFGPIDKGLAWWERNYEADQNPGNPYHYWYYLYGLERIGLASGYKYFGTHDWFKECTRIVLARQAANGCWQGTVGSTCWPLLFLARGRNPVMFNHLQYAGDWNNRPRALANLTRWFSQTLESEVAWQIINLKVPVSEWHDSPILYLSGSKAPKLTDGDLDKLRRYVWQGGTILSIAECGGSPFDGGMRKAYQKIFPNYEIQALPPTHPIYHVYVKITRRYPLFGISNGVRLLAVHVRKDLPRSWQTNRFATGKGDFDLAANLYLFVTDKETPRSRGTSMWPRDQGAATRRTVRVARLKYAGNHDPEPLAWKRFALRMAKEAGTRLEVSEPMAITDLKPGEYPVAHLTGMAGLALNNEQTQALKAYCAGGGTLIIDAAGGSRKFRKAAEDLLDNLFGVAARKPLAAASPVYNLPEFKIDKVRYRRATRQRLGKSTEPRLQGVTVDDRVVCLYSPEDLTAGLVGYQQYELDGYAPDPKAAEDSAFRIMRNAVLWAAGKNAEAPG